MADIFRGEELGEFKKYFTEIKGSCIACGSSEAELWTKSGDFKAVKCSKCSLIWMNPSSNETGLDLYYKNYIGRRRLNNDLKMSQRKLQYADDASFIEQFVDGGKILDVGCNGGFFLETLSQNFQKYGIEIDPEAVKFAQNTYKDFGDNVVCAPLENAPYEDSSFDMISMRGTIEHMTDPLNAIKKVSQLLKKDGFFCITATPNGMSVGADLYRNQWTLFHPVQHIWHFSPKSLSIICQRFNLKLIAKEFPYMGTPYENVKQDIKDMADAIELRRSNVDCALPVSPAFFESMMSLMFKKI